jgi:hypothetical protein
MRSIVLAMAVLAASACWRSSSSGESGASKKDEAKKEASGDDDAKPKKKEKSKPKAADDDASGKKDDGAKKDDPPAPSDGGAMDDTIVSLVMGHYRACVVRADGRVVCWGKSFVESPPPEAPTFVAGLTDAVQLAGDDGEFCAIRKDGEVACFGGEMKAERPASVPRSAETDGRCFRTTLGKVVCQTHDDAGKPKVETMKVPKPRALGRGTGNSCVIDEGGRAFCWGNNRYHQLADGTDTDRDAPVEIKKLASVDEIGSSAFERTCARTGAKVLCWGGEARKELVPTPMKGITDAVQLAVGEYHSCARLASGKIACWGSNSHGQLGVSGPDSADDPVIAKGVENVTMLAVGGGEPAGGAGSTCVVEQKKDDKKQQVFCWGALNDKKSPTKIDVVPAAAPAKPPAKEGKGPKG